MEELVLNSQKTDLGEGSIGKLMLRLAIPTVISQLVNMLYNIIDRMYIGRIPETGVVALTGLGLCFPVIMIVSAFSSLFGMGGAPKAAIEMGKDNNERAEKYLGNSFSALVITALILTPLILIFAEQLLFMFGASENTVTYALDYLNIYALGTIFVQISLGLNLFITTQGFSKYSMATVLIGAILNIILDPILIFGFGLGVKGAAIATIISQCVSAIWVLKFLTGNKTKLKIRKENMKIEKEVIVAIIALGMAPFVMQSTESILNISFNVSLQKYGGDLAVGGMTILGSIMNLFFMPLQGVTQGTQPIISYNFGAKKFDRVKKAVILQIVVCATATTVVWLLLMTVPEMFIKIFNDDPELVKFTTWAIRIYCFGYFILGIQTSCQQAFVSLGYAKISLFLACLRKIILLIPLIFILPEFFLDNQGKVFAVFLAEPVADILSAITTFICFVLIIGKVLKEEQA